MTPREKVLRLAKGRPVDPAPLVLPLAHAVGSRIDALDVREFLTNPTRLAKGLAALHDAIAADGIVCCCAGAMEAEGAGAGVSWTTYPPKVTAHLPRGTPVDALIERVLRSPRIAAAVEATRRLDATVRGEPALVACVTGPLTLARQLGGPVFDDGARADEAGAWSTLDLAARLGLAVARVFLSAGANLLLLREEDELPAPESAAFVEWKSALPPFANLSRFHQALPLLLPTGFAADGKPGEVLDQLPRSIAVCLPERFCAGALPIHERVAGIALAIDGERRRSPRVGHFVLTTSEISPDFNIGALRKACVDFKNS